MKKQKGKIKRIKKGLLEVEAPFSTSRRLNIVGEIPGRMSGAGQISKTKVIDSAEPTGRK